jgi:hypothetical protein
LLIEEKDETNLLIRRVHITDIRVLHHQPSIQGQMNSSEVIFAN